MRTYPSMALLGALVLALAVASAARAGSPITDMSVEQARQLLEQRGKDLAVLDVRTPEEFAQGHLIRAVNLNALAPDFESRLAQLDRGKRYLVYCRSGNRSTRAVQAMVRFGFTKLSHMTEGILGWQAISVGEVAYRLLPASSDPSFP